MPLYLVRHAHAGSRQRWDGPDAARPLSRKGRRRADEIGELLAGTGVERILSSPLVRCVETMEPLAALLGLDVERAEPLREGASPSASIALVEDLAASGTVAALCSHGDVIPDLLSGLARRGARLDPDGACPKGSIWVLDAHAGVVTDARYAATGPLPTAPGQAVTEHRRVEVGEIVASAARRAATIPSVVGVALCGSWAAERPRMDSDVDLVVLTTDRSALLADTTWALDLPGVDAEEVRCGDWGPHLTELRLRTASGLEVEVGLADPIWAATTPVDPGTARVVADGFAVLHDPDGVLGALVAAVESSTS